MTDRSPQSQNLKGPATGNDHGMDHSFDQRLDQVLVSLPRESADLGFTTRVMAHVEPARSRRAEPWLMLLASAALLLVTVAVGHQLHRQAETQRAESRVAALRVEQQALEDELSRLRAASRSARPVLYLGSDHGVDLIFDLTQLRQGDRTALPDYLKKGLGATAARPLRGGIQPATYQSGATY